MGGVELSHFLAHGDVGGSARAAARGTLEEMSVADDEEPAETVRHPHLADIETERDDGPVAAGMHRTVEIDYALVAPAFAADLVPSPASVAALSEGAASVSVPSGEGSTSGQGIASAPPSMRTLEDDRATEGAFLRGIATAPRDVACRLVYADWLEDRGRTEDAELVRKDLALRDMPPGDPGIHALRQEVEALLGRASQEVRVVVGALAEAAFELPPDTERSLPDDD